MNYRVHIEKVYYTVREVEADSERAAEDLVIDMMESDPAAFGFSHYEVETEELD